MSQVIYLRNILLYVLLQVTSVSRNPEEYIVIRVVTGVPVYVVYLRIMLYVSLQDYERSVVYRRITKEKIIQSVINTHSTMVKNDRGNRLE